MASIVGDAGAHGFVDTTRWADTFPGWRPAHRDSTQKIVHPVAQPTPDRLVTMLLPQASSLSLPVCEEHRKRPWHRRWRLISLRLVRGSPRLRVRKKIYCCNLPHLETSLEMLDGRAIRRCRFGSQGGGGVIRK